MSHTVITFLGKTRIDPETEGYRTAFYRFADGHRVEAAFFGHVPASPARSPACFSTTCNNACAVARETAAPNGRPVWLEDTDGGVASEELTGPGLRAGKGLPAYLPIVEASGSITMVVQSQGKETLNIPSMFSPQQQ